MDHDPGRRRHDSQSRPILRYQPYIFEPLAAKINGKEITILEYERSARRIDQYYSQLFGDNYGQFKGQVQIGTQAINELINRELLLADARRMGLGVSEEELAQAIRNDPNLQDASGNFVGNEQYQLLISRQIPGGTNSFESLIMEDMLVAKWLDVVTRSISVDDVDLETLHRNRTEKTAIRYVIVPSADMNVDTEVSDTEAQSWYDSHADDYQRSESRRIEYLIVSRDSVQDQVQISETEVRASYDENIGDFGHPARRRASHILLRTQDAENEEDVALTEQTANNLLQNLRGGTPFEDLARATSQDTVSAANGGDLGFFERGDMVPEFDEAAFNTPVGEISEVIQTQFGFHIIKVSEEQAAGTTPFEEVQDGILLRLQSGRSQDLVVAEAARIAEGSRTLEAFRSLAENESLTLVSLLVEKDEPLVGIAAAPGFRDSLFTLGVGEVSAPAAVGDGMGILAIVESLEAQIAPLQEVLPQVKTDIVNSRFRAAAQKVAQEAIDAGRSIAELATQVGGEMKESGDLAPGQGLPDAPLLEPIALKPLLFGDAIFIGERGVMETPGGALAYEVSGRQPWDDIAFEETKPSLLDEVRSERQQLIRQTMLDRLREAGDIVLNEAEINRLNG